MLSCTYILTMFGLIGSTSLAIENTKLRLIINAKLRGTLRLNSTKVKSQHDSEQAGKKPVTWTRVLTNSLKIKAGYDSQKNSEETGAETTVSLHSMPITGQYNSTTANTDLSTAMNSTEMTPKRKSEQDCIQTITGPIESASKS